MSIKNELAESLSCELIRILCESKTEEECRAKSEDFIKTLLRKIQAKISFSNNSKEKQSEIANHFDQMFNASLSLARQKVDEYHKKYLNGDTTWHSPLEELLLGIVDQLILHGVRGSRVED
jgi:hypothetical protein